MFLLNFLIVVGLDLERYCALYCAFLCIHWKVKTFTITKTLCN